MKPAPPVTRSSSFLPPLPEPLPAAAPDVAAQLPLELIGAAEERRSWEA